jgi:hypothetical protein
MPNPTINNVHVNAILSNLSIAYLQDSSVYVADKVFPNVPSQHRSDLYFRYKREDFFRDDMKERAPGTESAGGGYRIDTDSFFCKVNALHDDIADEIRANADSVLNMDRDSVAYLTQQAATHRELDWANAYFKAGVWTTNTTGQSGASSGSNTQFWNLATSTPIEDIRARIKSIQKLTAKKPNILVLGASAWYGLVDNPDLIDRVKYSSNSNTAPAQVTTGMIAALLGLDKIYVMEAVYNTAKEGQAFNGAFIGDKDALLVYAAPSAGVRTVSGGYTFSWAGFFGAGPAGNRIKKFRMEKLESDRIEIQMAYVFKLVSADLGAFFGTCVQ